MKKTDVYINKIKLKNYHHKEIELINIDKKLNEEAINLYDKQKSFKNNNIKINLSNKEFNKSYSTKDIINNYSYNAKKRSNSVNNSNNLKDNKNSLLNESINLIEPNKSIDKTLNLNNSIANLNITD